MCINVNVLLCLSISLAQKLKEQLEAGLKREAAIKEEFQQLQSTQQDLEERISVLTSELSAAQADITTARAEASTSKLAVESVRVRFHCLYYMYVLFNRVCQS